MARITNLIGFETQSLSEISGGFTQASDTPTINFGTPGRAGIAGTRYLNMQTSGSGSGNQSARFNFPPRSEIYFRIAARYSTIGRSPVGFAIRDASNNNIFSLTGAVGSNLSAVFGNSTGEGESVGSFSAATWGLVEGHLLIDNTVGVAEVKLDGVVIYSFGPGNTDPNNRVNATQLLAWGGNWNTGYMHLDDIAVNDVSGGVNDSWVGKGTVILLLPNGDGDASDLMGSDENQDDNWQLVDDPVADGDSTYVAGDMTGLKDLYMVANLPSLPGGTTIDIVQPFAVARRVDPSTLSNLDIGIKSDTTEEFAASQSLATSYALLWGDQYLEDPHDNDPWDEAKVNALQVGVETS